MACFKIFSLRLIAGNRSTIDLVNLGSLTLGMACALLLLLGARSELSYDSFHRNRNQIYRLIIEGETENGGTLYKPSLDYRLADSIKLAFLQSESPSRIGSAVSSVSSNRDVTQNLLSLISSQEPGSHYLTDVARLAPQQGVVRTEVTEGVDDFFYFAEPSVFDIFDLPLVAGNSQTALSLLSSVVLTEEMAGKYFGGIDPIGRMMVFTSAGHTFSLKVTGVLKPIPGNSSLRINFLAHIPFEQLAQRLFPQHLYTYTFLNFGGIKRPSFSFPGTVLQDLILWERPVHVAAVVSSFAQKLTNIPYSDPVADSSFKQYKLACESISDLHFTTDRGFSAIAGVRSEPLVQGNRFTVFFLIFLAVNIIAISCINVINITAANSAGRAREIAIRKIMGAERRRLIMGFLLESTLLSLTALIFSLSLVEILGPPFNIPTHGIAGNNPLQNYFSLGVIYCGLVLLTGFLSGIYPAFFLSSLPPIQSMHADKLPTSRKVQKGLLIFQMSSAISLLIFSLFFTMQGADFGIVSSSLSGNSQAHWHSSISFAGFSAIFLSALGLAGFAHYETRRRTKEIGIRKTLGATRAQLCFSFTARYIPVILSAIAIAWAISLAVVPRVFQMIDYPFMVSDRFSIMMFASSATLLITLSIVALQIFRAASIPPVEALRDE